MINALTSLFAVLLVSSAETDSQKIVAGALLAASLGASLREINGR